MGLSVCRTMRCLVLRILATRPPVGMNIPRTSSMNSRSLSLFCCFVILADCTIPVISSVISSSVFCSGTSSLCPSRSSKPSSKSSVDRVAITSFSNVTMLSAAMSVSHCDFRPMAFSHH